MTIELQGFFKLEEIEDMFDNSDSVNIKHYKFDDDGYCKIIIRSNSLKQLAKELSKYYNQ